MEFYVVITILMLGVAGVAATLAMLRWIANPLETLGRARRARDLLPDRIGLPGPASQTRIQFTVSDVLLLFAMLQMSVGTVHYLTSDGVNLGFARSHPSEAWIFDAFTAAIILLSWRFGASMASRAGVNVWWHRALILGFVAPCGIVSPMAIIFLVLMAVNARGKGSGGGLLATAILAGMAGVFLVMICACGLLTRWIAGKYPLHQRGREPQTPEEPSK